MKIEPKHTLVFLGIQELVGLVCGARTMQQKIEAMAGVLAVMLTTVPPEIGPDGLIAMALAFEGFDERVKRCAEEHAILAERERMAQS